MFEVAALTQGRPLYTVALAIFEALGLLVSSGEVLPASIIASGTKSTRTC